MSTARNQAVFVRVKRGIAGRWLSSSLEQRAWSRRCCASFNSFALITSGGTTTLVTRPSRMSRRLAVACLIIFRVSCVCDSRPREACTIACAPYTSKLYSSSASTHALRTLHAIATPANHVHAHFNLSVRTLRPTVYRLLSS